MGRCELLVCAVVTVWMGILVLADGVGGLAGGLGGGHGLSHKGGIHGIEEFANAAFRYGTRLGKYVARWSGMYRWGGERTGKG